MHFMRMAIYICSKECISTASRFRRALGQMRAITSKQTFVQNIMFSSVFFSFSALLKASQGPPLFPFAVNVALECILTVSMIK